LNVFQIAGNVARYILISHDIALYSFYSFLMIFSFYTKWSFVRFLLAVMSRGH